MIVRLARAGEADAIARLHIASRRAAYAGIFVEGDMPARILAERCVRWQQAIAAGNAWVAERTGALLGVAQVGPSRDDDTPPGTAELYLLYVALGAWRAGVGTLLVEHIEARSLADGYRRLTVWVLVENSIGVSFYRKRSFVDDGCARDVNGRGLIEVRFTKPLSNLNV